MAALPVVKDMEDVVSGQDHVSRESQPLLGAETTHTSEESTGGNAAPGPDAIPATSTTKPETLPQPSETLTNDLRTITNTMATAVEKLGQIAEFCSQTRRETSALKQRLSDLERGQQHVGSSADGPHLEGLEKPKPGVTPNLFRMMIWPPKRFVVPGSARSRMIEEIWAKVKPFPTEEELMIHQVRNGSEASIIQLFERESKALEEYLAQYPAWQNPLEQNKIGQEILIRRLKHRFEKVGERYSHPKIIAYCWSVLSKTFPDDRLGKLLKDCYEMKVFRKPKSLDDPLDLQILLYQIRQLVGSSILLNSTYKVWDFESRDSFDWMVWFDQTVTTVIAHRESIDKLLGISMSKLIQILHINETEIHEIRGAEGTTLRIDDLDVRSLMSIGKLTIKWSEFLQDHLKLNLLDMTLCIKDDLMPDYGQPLCDWYNSLVWGLPKTFAESVQDRPRSKDYESNYYWYANRELVGTWAILFAQGTQPGGYPTNLDQDSIFNSMPDTVKQYLRDKHLGKGIKSIGVPGSSTLKDAYAQSASAYSTKTPLSYDHFPVFEARLRQLRLHMDNQKPRGLRQLWRDNRDSLNYYTFWGVIIFGVLSVILAMFSLAVSVAQTVAAFRSLEGTATSLG